MSDNSEIDNERRGFLIKTTGVLGGIGALCALTPLVYSLLPSTKVQAENAPVKIDLSHLSPGEQMTVAWRGKPVWIIRRTLEMLRHLGDHNGQLRDPDSLVDQQPAYAKNNHRSIYPEYLVLVGICTHLGCAPQYKPNPQDVSADWPGGFVCPCHGSTFDLAGRVYKGVPAPINLAVPPHRFLDPVTLMLGENTL